jgi:hypothetical protein
MPITSLSLGICFPDMSWFMYSSRVAVLIGYVSLLLTSTTKWNPSGDIQCPSKPISLFTPEYLPKITSKPRNVPK